MLLEIYRLDKRHRSTHSAAEVLILVRFEFDLSEHYYFMQFDKYDVDKQLRTNFLQTQNCTNEQWRLQLF
ncbi:hypothetical protein [Sporosarcina aquimarina]|uniref:hypothetical protein n=1 Tax=Sporosarcina aquimarina TaxID=114975 RepID=UPI00295F1572|nr:hypothetical protein [Sporosarcina aquimarina]